MGEAEEYDHEHVMKLEKRNHRHAGNWLQIYVSVQGLSDISAPNVQAVLLFNHKGNKWTEYARSDSIRFKSTVGKSTQGGKSMTSLKAAKNQEVMSFKKPFTAPFEFESNTMFQIWIVTSGNDECIAKTMTTLDAVVGSTN